jgi:hypothetical protein
MADLFMVEKTFYDITDTVGLSANETKYFDASGRGQDGNNYMTPNTVTSSTTNGAVAREITSIEIIPPQDANGNYEDLREVHLQLDNKDYSHYITLPGNGNLLMTPLRTQVWGSPTFRIRFGEPLWRVLLPRHLGGLGLTDNIPLIACAPKFNREMSLYVTSRYGVTGAGSGGYRIIVKGYEYTEAELQYLQQFWRNTVYAQTLRQQLEDGRALKLTYPAPSRLSIATWPGFPGGTEQGTVKINPYWHFALNAQATQPNLPYALTTFPSLGGANGNVEDNFQNLGVQFNLNNDALLVRAWGVKGVPLPPGQTGAPGTPGLNLSRAGWLINGNEIPAETGRTGVFATQGVNPLAFGAASPTLDMANVFLPVPAFPGQLLLYKDNAVPFIADNGSAIPAYQVAVALIGVLVEQS